MGSQDINFLQMKLCRKSVMSMLVKTKRIASANQLEKEKEQALHLF